MFLVDLQSASIVRDHKWLVLYFAIRSVTFQLSSFTFRHTFCKVLCFCYTFCHVPVEFSHVLPYLSSSYSKNVYVLSRSVQQLHENTKVVVSGPFGNQVCTSCGTGGWAALGQWWWRIRHPSGSVLKLPLRRRPIGPICRLPVGHPS